MNVKFRISTNKEIINKSNVSKSNTFCATEMTQEEFIGSIKKGYAYSNVFLNDERKNENFLRAQTVSLDFDGAISISEIKENPFIKGKASCLYTTASHGFEGKDRFRAVFILSKSIEDADGYRMLLEGLLAKFPQADAQCKDPARFFYGNTNAKVIQFNNILDEGDVETLIQLGQAVTGAKASLSETKKARIHSSFSVSDVQAMLNCINKMPGRNIWRNITWALCAEFDEVTAYSLIEDWSCDYKTNGKETKRIIQDYDGRSIGLGTLIYQARKHGYKYPEHLCEDRTEGQVALQDMFNNGVGVITIAGTLYEYREGYYQELPDFEAEARIASYFNLYETSAGKNSFATKAKVSSALDFVKMSTTIMPGQVINPPGLNVNNGFIEITYGENDIPQYELKEHSVNRICLHKTEVDHSSNADSAVFDEALDSILSRESQTVLLRTIAASLDLEKVRAKLGRSVKALLLIGDGANGKDTLRAWTSALFGNGGMTYIPLQAFRSADQDRLNGIYSLIKSKVNWPSENIAISLDRCETLKKVITGEPTPIEKKYHDRIDIEPKTVCLFNSNGLPYMEGTQEAISSRYGALKFESCFKNKPDPSKPNEKKADPRLKDDKVYIKQQIVHAFLNRILKEFQDLMLQGGIEYKENSELMEQIREQSNHLLKFINDYDLEVSKKSDVGMPSEVLWKDYQSWCEVEGYMEKSLNSYNGKPIFHNPSNFDKLAESPGLLIKALKKVLPGMEERRLAKGKRGWNLVINFDVVDES